MEPKKDANRRSFGSAGEKLAAGYLQTNGYTLISSNYRVGRMGEIDIIARENGYLCFIEVKTRRSLLYGRPSEAISIKKQQTIRKIAQVYINSHKCHSSNVRFDVVEILYLKDDSGNQISDINLIKNAF